MGRLERNPVGRVMARVLIADDDEIMRLVYGAALEEEGHEVCYAADGEAVLEQYRGTAFDLVILDMCMPVKNGVLTLKELISVDPAARVIAVSGKSDRQLEAAKENGALRALSKSATTEQFRRVVASVLRVSRGWDKVHI